MVDDVFKEWHCARGRNVVSTREAPPNFCTMNTAYFNQYALEHGEHSEGFSFVSFALDLKMLQSRFGHDRIIATSAW